MFSEKELSNTIRMLSIDAIEKSQSGHPGMPMGMADIATVLWREFLKHNPKNPNWYDRDRFILSNGHGSMLLYSVLHLTGYDLTIKDIKKFRQYKSKTPGHPEIECTPGVEVTTGPLGQGLANAVGMAISEKILSAYFNKPTLKIVDHYTWVFMGDGCLMEGISHESCSLAGTLGLGKLIGFYDKNNISIDGEVSEWFTDNTYKRFKSYNWHVISDVDGHDFNSIRDAIKESKSIKDKPSLIICKTIIGYGSPNKSGLKDSHGSPLGSQEVSLVRKNLKWNYSPFKVSKNIYKHWSFIEQGEVLEKKWLIKFKKYQKKYPKLSKEYIRRMSSKIPTEWNSVFKNLLSKININKDNISTRQASQIVLERLGKIFPELIGGSADLAPSNLTQWSGSKSIKSNFVGNYIHYGVREFGMSAIANGIFHHGGFIPYTATFLMFFEYAHNAIRMAALMNTKHIFIYTHDSIGLGEDGPTHQPIEQLSILRLIPNLHVWRPANIIETAVSWKIALERKKGPSALILSRQNLPSLSEVKICFKDVSKGGYIFKDFGQSPQIIFIATGSELHLAFKAAEIIYNRGYCVRVVSMPNTNIFDNQDSSYKDFVLPTHVTKRIVVEAGIIDFWYKYVGKEGLIIGINQFGESAPAKQLLQTFGFTVSNIVKKALNLIV